MLSIKKYAAIDIGSNAIRLLIATAISSKGSQPKFKKTSLVRVPIRLGTDVFVGGKISKENYKRMKMALKAFKKLMKVHQVEAYMACATSAMREAQNGKKIAKRLKKKSGITIKIIDGKEEAAIIASTNIRDYIKNNKVYLYVDVGGGSTEFTVIAQGTKIASQSFKLGTVRILNGLVTEDVWNEVKKWIQESTKPYEEVCLLGSGGNINSTYKASGKKIGEPLNYFYLVSYYKKIKSLSYEERIEQLNMNPDRADVIEPALKIYLSAMKWSGAKYVFVPKIGLSDGIIRSLYEQNNR